MTRWAGERTDRELLDDVLAIYDSNRRDKNIPVPVSIPKKTLASFAQSFPGSNEKLWTYRGWILKNGVG